MKFLFLCAVSFTTAAAADLTVQAVDFIRQEKTEKREWKTVEGSLQVLPDTRRTHDDKLIRGENFSDVPGEMAVLSYRVRFPAPGRYYVWVRAFSTGTEDNGIHAGLNGAWPESGKRMQWCEGKREWTWASKQRTAANHCGEPGKIWLDVPSAGDHTVQFSMREDGFRFDQFRLTTDPPPAAKP